MIMLTNNKEIYYPDVVANIEKGESYIDPIFNTKITRITDATKTLDPGYGDTRNVINIVPEYPTICAFDPSDSYFILQHFSNYGLYKADGTYVKHLSFIAASFEPRWYSNNILLFIVNNEIRAYYINEDKIEAWYTFKEYSKISAKGEGDISDSGHLITLVGDEREVFLFDLLNKKKSPGLHLEGFDQLYTLVGRVLVGYYKRNLPHRYHGIEMFDKDMNFIGQLTMSIGHMDIYRPPTGNIELASIIWASAAEVKDNYNANDITKVYIDGKREILINFDWSLAQHVSCRNGRTAISTYAPRGAKPNDWKLYTDEVVLVEADKTIKRVCHHLSKPIDDYVYTPKIVLNRKATKALLSSNMGRQPWVNYADTYMIDLKEPIVSKPIESVETHAGHKIVYELDKFNAFVENDKITITRK
jgi:hypothetical protein